MALIHSYNILPPIAALTLSPEIPITAITKNLFSICEVSSLLSLLRVTPDGNTLTRFFPSVDGKKPLSKTSSATDL